MPADSLRKRATQSIPAPLPDFGAGTGGKAQEPHPAGKAKHGPLLQIARILALTTWFHGCCVTISATQFLGSPLYWINRDWYYAWMALTKQSFGVLIITITQWFAPTTMRISWDPSLKGQFRLDDTGLLQTKLPERLILIANHQIYTDWLFLWWFSYTSQMHGHIYIILKESLKYIPVLGPGMMFFGFIFMARKWASDKSRLQHRLQKLRARHDGPMSGPKGLDPMWLLIFPEGTNLSANTRKKSLQWAQSQKIPDMKHQVMPRSTGLHFCLDELQDTVEWVYDCTMAYEGVTPGGYAQDIFTIRSSYAQERPPKSVNMYWRRFAVKDIPLTDEKSFEKWVLDRWREKDELLDGFYRTGRFPAGISGAEKDVGSANDYLETKVKFKTWWNVAQIFVVLASAGLLCNVIAKLLAMFA